MSLNDELCLKKPIAAVAHEALLNIYFTSTCIRKQAAEFLRRFNLTDVQLNLMMMLRHQSAPSAGLTQARISNLMLVNPANITSLIDRMERAKLVIRSTDPDDRRSNIITLTPRANGILDKVEPLYAKEVARMTGVLTQAEQKKLIGLLEKIRANVT